MQPQWRNRLILAALAGFSVIAMGAALVVTTKTGPQQGAGDQQGQTVVGVDQSLAGLILAPTEQRLSQLATLARQPRSLTQYRARYLLATDLIQLKRSKEALAYLDGLESDYTAMAPYVLRQQAIAYGIDGNPDQAKRRWQQLLQDYPNDPIAAEALIALGQSDDRFLKLARERFPAYPGTLDGVRSALQQNPNQPDLLLHLVRHAFYAPGIVSIADKLVGMQARVTLSPEDWQAIAFVYWENQAYGKAGLAYAKAPPGAMAAYRTGRGLQLGGKVNQAMTAYEAAIKAFPQSEEAALALSRLAKLSQNSPKKATAYLDTIVAKFPDDAAAALLDKADLFHYQNNPKAALALRKQILEQYPTSQAAADIRWQEAHDYAKQGDLKTAIQWVEPISTDSPTSKVAPKATFWAGKWAAQMGDKQQAVKLFEQVLRQYPESYYAWRSASMLGYNVGDFTTVRRLTPKLVLSTERSPLPAGSPPLQELYQLGLNWDAWARWQVEFQSPMTPTMAQQFTDGILRFGVGDHLDGIFMLDNLSDRRARQDQADYQLIRRQSAYWKALYPLPYITLVQSWSQQRQLNPLLVIALIRQESRFEPGIRSSVGATGLMQVMPDTGAWIANKVGLDQPYRLDHPEDNVMMGTWYLDYTHQEYGNNSLLAVASYNAGPGNVADWLSRFSLSDPDSFVDQIPFDETRGYVEAVFENYWNYLRLYDPDIAQVMAEYTTIQSASR